jgi:hypothetical protein
VDIGGAAGEDGVCSHVGSIESDPSVTGIVQAVRWLCEVSMGRVCLVGESKGGAVATIHLQKICVSLPPPEEGTLPICMEMKGARRTQAFSHDFQAADSKSTEGRLNLH